MDDRWFTGRHRTGDVTFGAHTLIDESGDKRSRAFCRSSTPPPVNLKAELRSRVGVGVRLGPFLE
jgi:hypothetical protein